MFGLKLSYTSIVPVEFQIDYRHMDRNRQTLGFEELCSKNGASSEDVYTKVKKTFYSNSQTSFHFMKIYIFGFIADISRM